MMHRISALVLYFSLLLTACSHSDQDGLLEDLLHKNSEMFAEVLDFPDRYGVQVIYSRIDRDAENQPVLKHFTYRVDPEVYFYPASMVKLPIAILSLERLNQLNVPGLTKYSLMLTDSAWSGQTSVKPDTSSENWYPSVARYIREIFLVSDNNAFNRLYEFLGPDYINGSLHRKGYTGSRIVHRLSLPLTPEENRYTNPVRFYDDGQLIYHQELARSTRDFSAGERILLGDGYIRNDSLINEPMDFSAKNFIPLQELHSMLVSVVFPECLDPESRFHITGEDRDFLLACMSMYPRESSDPAYGEEFSDNYCKFLMYGDRTGMIPENIRIFNKIGLAYGFLIESAYIVDFEAKIEFFLSAVIRVNANRIYNDGVYEYDSVGFPFMGNLGRMMYAYEKERNRTNIPDLSEFTIHYK